MAAQTAVQKDSKTTGKSGKAAGRRTPSGKTANNTGRIAAPLVRLGMTPNEVRDGSGQPECILFGAEDRVEWQFGATGTNYNGGPTLFVTTLTFEAGRVIKITERMRDPN